MGTLTRKSLRRGLEVIEAVITLPLVLLVLLGLGEYGNLFLQEQTITNIARQTARAAAVPGGNYTGTFATLKSDAGGSYSNLTANYNNVGGASGTLLEVSVSMSYASITGGWIPTPSNLSANVWMENEGP